MRERLSQEEIVELVNPFVLSAVNLVVMNYEIKYYCGLYIFISVNTY